MVTPGCWQDVLTDAMPQRDDERYPTLVERRDGENAPEVVPPPIDHFGADKQASDGNAASASVSGSYWTGSPMGGTPFIPLKTDDGSMPEAIEPGGAPAATAHRTICGIRRRTFWIIVIIVSTAVLGGVLGGIIGGLANDGQLFTSDDEDDNGAPASTQTSGPIEPSQRAMAVSISVSDDGADQELQLFYQDLDTQAILYRRIRNDEARDEKTVALNHVPLWASPLAAAAINKSDPVSTQLFYMTADDDGRPAVAVAKLKCVADKEACTTDANDIISGGEDSDVALHPDTKLAALRLGDDTIRLYYQDEGGAIFALNGDDADNDQGGQWTAHAITDAAAPGSSFVAVGPRKEDISVFYISESNETLSLVQYSDLQGPGDGKSYLKSLLEYRLSHPSPPFFACAS
jgi:hypothetical protein